METKDKFVVFLGVLLLLLFCCPTFSVVHNSREITALQRQLRQVTIECHKSKESDDNFQPPKEQETLFKLIKELASTSGLMDNEKSSVRHLRRHIEKRMITAEAAQNEQQPEDAIKLLTNALSVIVNKQLESKLDCSRVENDTECSILPGPPGIKGLPGPIGERGDKGDVGEKGQKGEVGHPGYPGYKGQKGEVGSLGYPGQKGDVGQMGVSGEKGDKGDNGEKGQKGALGYPGHKGDKGQVGDFGPPGPVGERGDKGDIGQKGEQGPFGFPGYKGEKGEIGSAGPPGPTGPKGSMGPAGTLSQSGCSWHSTCTSRTTAVGRGERITRYTCTCTEAKCPAGQYVAGFNVNRSSSGVVTANLLAMQSGAVQWLRTLN